MLKTSGNDEQFCTELMNINVILKYHARASRTHTFRNPLSIFLATPLQSIFFLPCCLDTTLLNANLHNYVHRIFVIIDGVVVKRTD